MLPKENIQTLIGISTRRLQKLKEQQALKGANSPPELLIEIEDLEAKIATIAFIDLSKHGADILTYLAQAREYLPSIVFILL